MDGCPTNTILAIEQFSLCLVPQTLKGLDASPARNRASTSPQQRLTGLTGRTRSTSKQVGNSLESERLHRKTQNEKKS
ncbi:hypothetical protein CMEL01_07876 [Colletotrichum melonis]|uniref:Uncharacterized protein n=1 Tax=Colletotrichum melonis TaxID=1209925 RepID=A0AAI9XIU0_9PEZI|nr:hypothetical protein CMEL01_07876 [Colletotrichum melonis]